MPGRALLHATAQGAVAWLVANRDRFDPDEVTLRGRRDKPVVELAVLLRALRDVGAAYNGLEDLTAVVREVSLRPGRRHAPRPARGPLLADVMLFAAASGAPCEDAAEHRRLQRLVDLRLLDTAERPPHRVMEDRLALEWAGLRHPLPPWEELARGSLLGTRPNPAFLDEAAAYQLTHVVFYATAFGTRPFDAGAGDDGLDRQCISTLLLRFVADRHWDLVGELLMSWAFLGFGPSALCEAAWAALLSQVEPGGAVAQPRGEAAPESGAEADAWFLDRYHPTLVLTLAANAWRGRSAPLPSRSGTAASPVEPSVMRELAEEEAAWLALLLDASGDPRVACDVLAGLWTCAALNDDVRGRLPAATARATEALRGVLDWTRIPAGVALVAFGVLARSQAAPDGLAAFVDVAAEALRAAAPGDLDLAETRVLMHALGRAEPPTRASLAEVVALAEATPLDSTAHAVERLVLTCESSAAYGSQPVDLGPGEGWIPELLLAHAAERARTYDLVGASRLTRAAVHLDPSARGGADLVEVLLAHRHAEGGFGLFGDEAHGAAAERLRLRLSVEALRTVAEAATSWRLASAVSLAPA